MKTLVAVLAVLLITCGAWAFVEGPLRNPEAAVRDFLESTGRFEDQLTDPVVLAGPRVRPLVLSAISDRDMKRRRYALAYLGCAGYAPAEGALRSIATDETEADYFRADALEAVWRINPREGRGLASSLRARTDFLGRKAEQLLTTEPLVGCRSWLAALTRRHD